MQNQLIRSSTDSNVFPRTQAVIWKRNEIVHRIARFFHAPNVHALSRRFSLSFFCCCCCSCYFYFQLKHSFKVLNWNERKKETERKTEEKLRWKKREKYGSRTSILCSLRAHILWIQFASYVALQCEYLPSLRLQMFIVVWHLLVY